MGLLELLVIAVVGLLVIGPERLPHALKSGLVWVGRIKRMLSDTRSEFEQQLGLDEIRREIHNEQIMESLNAVKKAQQAMEAEAAKTLDTITGDIEGEIKSSTESSAAGDTKKLNTNPLDNFSEDFPEDDEGLYGEQTANHAEKPAPAETGAKADSSAPESSSKTSTSPNNTAAQNPSNEA